MHSLRLKKLKEEDRTCLEKKFTKWCLPRFCGKSWFWHGWVWLLVYRKATRDFSKFKPSRYSSAAHVYYTISVNCMHACMARDFYSKYISFLNMRSHLCNCLYYLTVLVMRKQFYIGLWFYLYHQLKPRTVHGIDHLPNIYVSHNYPSDACVLIKKAKHI